MNQASSASGAYGFRITGVEDLAPHLPAVPANWPELRLSKAVSKQALDGSPPPGTIQIEDDGAQLWLAEAGQITMTRRPLTVTFATRVPLSTDALLHPFLGLPAVIASRWLGRVSLHAGGFVHGDRAWIVLGDRLAGKSTTLALIAHHGHQVLADDIVVTDRGTAFAGPRSVDLREEAAAAVGGEPLGMVGNRPRWRMRPAAAPAKIALGGLIALAWGKQLSIEPLDVGHKLRRLVASAALAPNPADAMAMLDLAVLPALCFTRPKRLRNASGGIERLLDSLPLS